MGELNNRFTAVREMLAPRSGSEHLALFEPLFEALWAARDRDAPPPGVAGAAAETLGPELLDRGLPPSSAVRWVLASGRALTELALADGELDGAGAGRLAALIDDAAVEVATAIERARRERRQAWLGFLVHELKNPLNTMLNALWLLREKGASSAQAPRFLDLAERALRRLELRARDVRELDEELLRAPPGWESARRPEARR